jgi:hypothetical protein
MRVTAGNRDAAGDRLEDVALAEVDDLVVREHLVNRAIVVAREDDVLGRAGLVEDVPGSELVTGHRKKAVVNDGGLLGLRMLGIRGGRIM